jgi:hypothetical protein
LNCWSPSIDDHHWLKYIKELLHFTVKSIVAFDGIQSYFTYTVQQMQAISVVKINDNILNNFMLTAVTVNN